jgi:protein phosphatase
VHHRPMPVLTLADPCLVALVGVAGSGKSTLASRLFESDEVLSSDALRAKVAGDEADQTASGVAFTILHRELGRRLAAGRLTVVDATNVRAAHRAKLVSLATHQGIPMAAIVFDLPIDLVQARNAARSRVVDPEVIARQLRWLRETVDGGRLGPEGFDPVVVLRTQGDIDRLEVRRRSVDRPG